MDSPKSDEMVKVEMFGIIGNMIVTLSIIDHTSDVIVTTELTTMSSMWDGSSSLIRVQGIPIKRPPIIIQSKGLVLPNDKFYLSQYIALKTSPLFRTNQTSIKIKIQDIARSTAISIEIIKGKVAKEMNGLVGFQKSIFYNLDLEMEEKFGDLAFRFRGFEFGIRKDVIRFYPMSQTESKMAITFNEIPTDELLRQSEFETPKKEVKACFVCENAAEYVCPCNDVAWCSEKHRDKCWKSHHKTCTWASNC